MANYDNGNYRSNSLDFFQIKQPNFDLNSAFCDANAVMKSSNLIPNSNYIIYISESEYNSNGDHKYWISLVDLTINKVIRKFGAKEKPLTFNDPPIFEGFNKDNMPIYSYSGKYHLLNISSGISQLLISLPRELIKKTIYDNKIQATLYRGISTIEKYQLLKDSSYVKLFNNKLFLESKSMGKLDFGSSSSLVLLNKNHKIIDSLNLFNINIWDFAVDEFNDRIAISYGSRDSIYLAYYDLNSFKLISYVFRRARATIDNLPGNVRFSQTGTYLLYNANNTGTVIYLGNKLYFGFEGSLYGFNNNENVIITGDNSGAVKAFDLEKKTIIWIDKINSDYFNTKFFNIENKIYYIFRPSSSAGLGPVTLRSVSMPKPMFSLIEFTKNPEEIINGANSNIDSELVKKNNSNQQLNDKLTKTNDEILNNYFAIMFLTAIKESSNKHAKNTNRSSRKSRESIPTCTCKWCGRHFLATKKNVVTQIMSDYIQGGQGTSYECAEFCSRRCEVENSYYQK